MYIYIHTYKYIFIYIYVYIYMYIYMCVYVNYMSCMSYECHMIVTSWGGCSRGSFSSKFFVRGRLGRFPQPVGRFECGAWGRKCGWLAATWYRWALNSGESARRMGRFFFHWERKVFIVWFHITLRMNWIPESAERGVLGGESSQASDVFIAFHAFRWQRHRWVTRPHMATHGHNEPWHKTWRNRRCCPCT